MRACAVLGRDGVSVRQSLPGVCDVQADYRDALKLWLLMSLVTERTDPCLLLPYTEPSGTLTKGPMLNLSFSSALYVPLAPVNNKATPIQSQSRGFREREITCIMRDVQQS